MSSSSPFGDLYNVINQLPAYYQAGHEDMDGLFPVSLVDISSWLAGWQQREVPSVVECHICVFASCYAPHTAENVKSFIADASTGKAAVNRLCVDHGIGLRVLELAPELPHDLTQGWSEEECMAAVAFGMEAAAAGGNLLGLSSIAPGEETAAKNVMDAIEELQKTGEEDWHKGLAALKAHGGREIAASIGALIAARSRQLPVIIDSWAGLAAIVTLNYIQSGAADHSLVAASLDDAFAAYAARAGRRPLVAPYIAGEAGCGNAVAVSLLKAACDI